MADCKSLIPSMCGNRVPNIASGTCAAVHFRGIDDVTIKQGVGIDLTEGVHAYNGEGEEIPFTVSPTEIDACNAGTHTVTYSAVGVPARIVPSFCEGKKMLAVSDCGTETVTENRIVTIESLGEPTISGAYDERIFTDVEFDPLYGVSAVDGEGNSLEVTYSGTGYTEGETAGTIVYADAGTHTLTYTATDRCGNTTTVNRELSAEVTPTCFVKGTKVWTENGLANIEDVAVGDKVLSYNDLTEETELGEVTNVIKDSATSVYVIGVGGETISVTGEHRMYLPTEDRYESAENLKVGDELLKADGSHVAIDSIEETSGEYEVYNLEVDTLSNYFVGEGGYLSYNMNISGVIRLSPKSLRSSGNTQYFTVMCTQGNATHPISGSFVYEITPADDDVPPLNGSVDRKYAFSMEGDTTMHLDLSVDISEDGSYEYSVKPRAVSAPCHKADEEYTLTLYVVSGVLRMTTIMDSEYAKTNSMTFAPWCVDPE